MSYRDIGLSEVEHMPLPDLLEEDKRDRKAWAEVALVAILLAIASVVSFVVLPYFGII